MDTTTTKEPPLGSTRATLAISGLTGLFLTGFLVSTTLVTPLWGLVAAVVVSISTLWSMARSKNTAATLFSPWMSVVVGGVFAGVALTLNRVALPVLGITYLAVLPLLGTVSFVILAVCALVFAVLAQPWQPETPLSALLLVSTVISMLATVIVAGSETSANTASAVTRLRVTLTQSPVVATAHPGDVRLWTITRRASRPLIGATIGAVLAVALTPVSSVPKPFGSQTLSDATGHVTSTQPADYTGSSDVDLNRRFGTLPTTPVAVVPDDSPVYWRGGIASGYNGSQLQQYHLPNQGTARTRQLLQTSTVAVPSELNDVDPPTSERQTYGVSIYVSNSNPSGSRGKTVVLTPGPATQVTAHATFMTLTDGATLELSPPTAYSVSASPRSHINQAPTRDQATPDDTNTTPAALWRDPGPTVTARTIELAQQLTANRTSIRGKTLAIEDYLRSTYRYDLQAPVARAGYDAVDYFLFTSRRGFCVHFAAAEMVLLRSVGISARIATGYAGGKSDPSSPGQRIITADRAHAWVEVWVPGLGWVTSDATPGGSSSTQQQNPGIAWPSWQRVVAVLATLTLGVGLWRLGPRLRHWWRRHPRSSRWRLRRGHRNSTAPPDLELEAAYARLTEALAETATPHQTPETLRELGFRLPQARPGLETLARIRYDRHPVSPAAAAQAITTLDDVTTALRAR